MSFYSPLLNALNKSLEFQIPKNEVREIEKLQNSVKESTKFVSIAKSNLNKDITQTLKKLRPDLTVQSKNVNIKDCWILEILDSTTATFQEELIIFISIYLEHGKINICALYNLK